MQTCPSSQEGRNLSAQRIEGNGNPDSKAGLKVQPNEHRCRVTKETHILPLKPCCPISGNPKEGSEVSIEYRANEHFLEVASLREYVDSYVGGRGDVRSMEGMIQQIAQDCSNAVQTSVHVQARLVIDPNQRMLIECSANPTPPEPSSNQTDK